MEKNWIDIHKQQPEPNTWVIVLTDEEFETELYFIDVDEKSNIAIFSETSSMNYVFPANEEGITHWKILNEL